MKTPKVVFVTVAAAAAVALAAPAANASCINGGATGCQVVSGVVTSSSLGFGAALATSVNLSTITPGSTSTITGLIPVVSVGNWTLKVSDDNTGATAGKLVASGLPACSGSAAALSSKLSVYPTAANVAGLDTFVTSFDSTTPHPLDGTATSIATGTISDTVTAHYTQPVAESEPLKALCSYSLTAVYGLS
jgi:hypothetical protein